MFFNYSSKTATKDNQNRDVIEFNFESKSGRIRLFFSKIRNPLN